MKLYFLAGTLFTMIFFFGSFIFSPKTILVSQRYAVEEVLTLLGERPMPHQVTFIKGVSAKAGEELVKYGTTRDANGKKVTRLSKHFVCSSCHNIEREDPDISVSDPQARLEYVSKNGLPFLQGTTLYGAVNRSLFYNGDYEKKYGALTKKARNNIRESIQLCAVECSQGRKLKPWELESVLAYLWTIDLKLSDLNLSENELEKISNAIKEKKKNKEVVALIKSRFLPGSPATFIAPPENRKTGYDLTGNPKNGALIYTLSCLHCHQNQRYAFFELDNSNLSKNFLTKHFHRYTNHSVYQVGRYGTPPKPGKRAYMPQYPEEKMSKQQMEDLRAYLKEAGS